MSAAMHIEAFLNCTRQQRVPSDKYAAASQGQTKNMQDSAARTRKKLGKKSVHRSDTQGICRDIQMQTRHFGKCASLNLKSGIRRCSSKASGPQTSRRLASDSPSKYGGSSMSAPFQIIGPFFFILHFCLYNHSDGARADTPPGVKEKIN